jgi:spoIIIJ-associated protein
VSSNVDETIESKGAEPSEPEAAKPEPKHNEAVADRDDGEDLEAAADAAADDDADVAADDDAPKADEAKAKADDEDEGPFEEDGRADKALDFVVEVLSTMGLDCTVDLMENTAEDPPSDIRIEITGHDAERLVGKKGQTLAALQFLTNRVINRPGRSRRHILIDSDGYRARREQALSAMAEKLGKQALKDGKIITFEPMTAQDRRVVHLALAKFQGVVTKSEGKGASRRVQIIPVRD